MPERFEPRESLVPGDRTVVRLNVSDPSLPVLLAGVDVTRMWLVDEGDGVYGLHATQTIGTTRDQGGEPATDILVRLVNSFADELDEEDVPPRLRAMWDRLVAEYTEKTARATAPLESPSGEAEDG